MKQKIHFIMTGGTIDGTYDAVNQTARPSRKSHIPAYIRDIIKPFASCSFETLFMKDSREITEGDRGKMLAAIKKSRAQRIILTHGTDTMGKTADFLKAKLGKSNEKTIVITGSMIPLSGFTGSDSGFNLGFVFAEAQHLPPGVYIAMHGHAFKAGTVKKNVKKARFEPKGGKAKK